MSASPRSVALGATVLALALCATPPPAAEAHESRPAYLELAETAPGVFGVTWRRPALGDRVLSLEPVFPGHCGARGERVAYLAGGASVERWRLDCGGAGLVGHPIRIEGLSATITDALIRVTLLEGPTYSEIVSGSSPVFALEGEPSLGEVARDYAGLGVEHILGGIDHLLFVFALMLLVGSPWVLVKTITAFTVAHSITLGAATLGFLHVPQAPVEAVIALSIVFLARELAVRSEGARDLTARAPWIVAFVFGLLHGLGFAGALAEVGLPRLEIPLALLTFNLGVEAGQLAFIGAVLGARLVAAPLAPLARSWLPRAAAYGIGATACYWLLERVAGFW